MDDLKRFSSEGAIGEHDGHPREVCADIKPDREVGDACGHLRYFLSELPKKLTLNKLALIGEAEKSP